MIKFCTEYIGQMADEDYDYRYKIQ